MKQAFATLGASMAIAAVAAHAQGSLHQVPIVDPVLGMTAWTLSAPADWSVDGTMMPGSSCASVTTPVYRALSADGKSGAYFLPRSDWAWGGGVQAGPDCLAFREVVSARDFLTYLIRIQQVGFVREEPTPNLEEHRRSMAAFDQQTGGQRRSSVDEATYRVRYSVAGAPVEELVNASVNCSDTSAPVVGHRYACSALVTRTFAPLGKLDALRPTFDAMKLTLDQRWMNAWTNAMMQRMTILSRQQTAALLRQGDLAQAARSQAHRAYMDSSERGRDVRNQTFREQQYQKQRNSDNFVDYVLDCQRAYGSTGRISAGSNCPNRQTY